ncbi:hypothetical protein JBE04_29415 [Streptomyces sp. PRKS01-29]|nr:hypothetical protein [Streptomyces sabulosicollis]
MFDQVMARIAGRFRRVEPRASARSYLLGLLSGVERKNCWEMAEQAHDLRLTRDLTPGESHPSGNATGGPDGDEYHDRATRPKPWEISDELWAMIEPLLPMNDETEAAAPRAALAQPSASIRAVT